MADFSLYNGLQKNLKFWQIFTKSVSIQLQIWWKNVFNLEGIL